MTDSNGRAKFSLADGRIEIEGSEGFVAAQLEKLEPLFKSMFEHRTLPLDLPPPRTPPQQSASAGAVGNIDEYRNVFALADGKIQILKTLPGGSSKATKTLNAALLLAFANELKGLKTTMTEELRTVCTSHACYDSPNFAKTFKTPSGKEAFTISGSGGAQTFALTHPGKTKAKALADSLNQ